MSCVQLEGFDMKESIRLESLLEDTPLLIRARYLVGAKEEQ